MATDSTSTYDEIPYSDGCFHVSHPDHLAALAAVHGVKAPAVDRCRVLEIGCARGGNILPMALELPEASFVGLDLSVRQIEEARKALGGQVFDVLGKLQFEGKPLRDLLIEAIRQAFALKQLHRDVRPGHRIDVVIEQLHHVG